MANWYAYRGGDPLLPGSYRIVGVKPSCISGGCTICAIYLNQNSATPSSIDANVLEYLSNSIVTLTPQPSTSKPFVYVKNC